VPAPLLRHPLEEGRHRQDVHPADPEDLIQIAEGDGRVELGSTDWGTDARVGNLEARAILRSEITRLGDRRQGDRGQIGQQLGVLVPHRLHDHRIGGADQGAPGLLIPELKVFSGNQFVADDAPGDGPEAGLVAGVDDLLRRGGIEVGDGFRTEDQRAGAAGGDGKSPPDFAVYLDGVVGANGQALTRADTGLVVYLGQHLLVYRHSNGVGRADADTGQARDAELGVNDEIQRPDPSGGRVCNLTARRHSVKMFVAAKYVYSCS
jgi:hypothetical protein